MPINKISIHWPTANAAIRREPYQFHADSIFTSLRDMKFIRVIYLAFISQYWQNCEVCYRVILLLIFRHSLIIILYLYLGYRESESLDTSEVSRMCRNSSTSTETCVSCILVCPLLLYILLQYSLLAIAVSQPVQIFRDAHWLSESVV